MKFCTIRTLCTAAVVTALAVPTFAQPSGDTPPERRLHPGGDAARQESGAEREVAPALRNTNPQTGTVQTQTRPARGTQTRPATSDGVIVEEGAIQVQGRPEAGGRMVQRDNQQGQLSNAAIARWVAADNEAEIHVAEVAQRQSDNAQVKQFAAMLVQDHTQFGEKVRQAANSDRNNNDRNADRVDANNREGAATEQTETRRNRDAARANRETADGNNGQRDNADGNNAATRETNVDRNDRDQAEGRQGQAGQRGMRGMANNNPAVMLHEEIKDRCAESSVAMLKQKQGAEFDAAFLGMQIVAHMGMIDTLNVAQQHATGDLKATLQQGEQTTKQHLQKAKDLMQQLEKNRS